MPSLYRGYDHNTSNIEVKIKDEASNLSGNEKRVRNNKSTSKKFQSEMNRSAHATNNSKQNFRSINKKTSKLLDDLFIMSKHRKHDGSYNKSVILNFL